MVNNLKTISKEVANEIGYPEEEVEKLTSLIYEDYLKQQLSEFKYSSIEIDKLGYINFRVTKADEYVRISQLKHNKIKANMDSKPDDYPLKEVMQKTLNNIETSIENVKILKEKAIEEAKFLKEDHKRRLEEYYEHKKLGLRADLEK